MKETPSMNEKPMTYAGSGVNYEAMDPFKLVAQQAARRTDECIERFGFTTVPWSRGESAFLVETPWGYIGFVVEGLGTKSLVADALCQLATQIESLTGRSFYDQVAQCNAAMAFNDLITLGVSPLIYGQYLAVGDSSWFDDKKRCRELVEGTKKACELARCTWGGGETPTLKGIIVPGTADLAGATVGIAFPKSRLIDPVHIRHGDAIVLLGSSGIHANALTLARKIAEKLPEGYLTRLVDGRTYGETLLDPTQIYVGLVEDCLDSGVHIHYAVNITGHGWRKLMRAQLPFTYVIERLPRPLPIFDFLQKHGPIDDLEAYGNFNMSAGFALYAPDSDTPKILEVAHDLGYYALVAGHIELGDKKVVIKPKGIEFAAETLQVR